MKSFFEICLFPFSFYNQFLCIIWCFRRADNFNYLIKFSTETDKPISICARSSALSKSNFVLITTSSLNFKKLDKNFFKSQVSGFPSTIANVLKPNELSI